MIVFRLVGPGDGCLCSSCTRNDRRVQVPGDSSQRGLSRFPEERVRVSTWSFQVKHCRKRSEWLLSPPTVKLKLIERLIRKILQGTGTALAVKVP